MWEQVLAQAWYTAALTKSRRLPPLQNLLNPPKTRTLTPEEKVQRRAEFEELKARMGGAAQKNAR